MDIWRDQLAALTDSLGKSELPCRVMIGQDAVGTAALSMRSREGVSVERDPSPLRGTGGLLCDLSQQYDEDDVLLVANAAQLLLEPLPTLAADAAQCGGDVTVVANGEGSGSSVMMISCRALRGLPTIGFVDLKEQALSQIARTHEITVLSRTIYSGLSVRTPQGYLAALQAYHRLGARRAANGLPFSEQWGAEFRVVEQGAYVDPAATLHDTVVLRGARVSAGAFVARSIVCAGAAVRRKQVVARRLLSVSGSQELEPASR